MESLLPIILAIVLNFIPANVTKMTIEVTSGGTAIENYQLDKLADGGWKGKDGVIYLEGAKLIIKEGDRSITKDFTKKLILGSMPCKITHHPEGFDLLFERDFKAKVRWESE